MRLGRRFNARKERDRHGANIYQIIAEPMIIKIPRKTLDFFPNSNSFCNTTEVVTCHGVIAVKKFC